MNPGARLAAPCASLALAVVLAGCGSGDGEEPAGDPTVPAGVAGEVEGEELGRGAEVDDFCAALAEIDESIDEARPDAEEDWLRIVAAFDALRDVGTPDDFPEQGRTELVTVDRLVRQSDDVGEFSAAADRESPQGYPVVDDYIDEHCDR